MTFERDTSVHDFWDKLLPWWGMLFRFFFIACLGFGAWLWLEQPGIGDIPIGQLTLKKLGTSILSWLAAVGSIAWFFTFPSKDKGLSYSGWGKFGFWAVVAGVLAWVILVENVRGR